MDLINDKNDIAAGLDLANQTLHTALKLTSELGACHKGGQIQQKHFLIAELIGHIPLCDPLGKPLSNGGLTNARLTNKARVILLSTVENLDNTLGLYISADDLIQLSLPGAAGKIHTIGIQEFVLIATFFLLRRFRLFLRLLLLFLRQIATKHLIQQWEGCSTAFSLILVLTALFVLTEHTAHFLAELLQFIFGNAHLLHHLVDLGHTKLTGAAQTEAFV